MRQKYQLTINGHAVAALGGETLLAASLKGPNPIPNDCESGECTGCRVRVLSGFVDDQGTAMGDTVLACEATVAGDAAIAFEEVPAQTKRVGLVHSIRTLRGEIVEVVIALPAPLPHHPGQHLRLTFEGFPARSYSPTVRLNGASDPRELVFHIQRRADSEVSRELGLSIRHGHTVTVRGPFGHAFHRQGPGRLILIADGTGFAPIWAIAHACRLTEPERPLLVMVHAAETRNLYMAPALNWLSHRGAEIILTSPTGNGGSVLPGSPEHYLPTLEARDIVHVAGEADLVDRIKERACDAGALCHSERFLPSRWTPTLRERIDAMIALATRMRQVDPGTAASGRREAGQPRSTRPDAASRLPWRRKG